MQKGARCERINRAGGRSVNVKMKLALGSCICCTTALGKDKQLSNKLLCFYSKIKHKNLRLF